MIPCEDITRRKSLIGLQDDFWRYVQYKHFAISVVSRRHSRTWSVISREKYLLILLVFLLVTFTGRLFSSAVFQTRLSCRNHNHMTAHVGRMSCPFHLFEGQRGASLSVISKRWNYVTLWVTAGQTDHSVIDWTWFLFQAQSVQPTTHWF